jgi:hypothetical protein
VDACRLFDVVLHLSRWHDHCDADRLERHSPVHDMDISLRCRQSSGSLLRQLMPVCMLLVAMTPPATHGTSGTTAPQTNNWCIQKQLTQDATSPRSCSLGRQAGTQAGSASPLHHPTSTSTVHAEQHGRNAAGRQVNRHVGTVKTSSLLALISNVRLIKYMHSCKRQCHEREAVSHAAHSITITAPRHAAPSTGGVLPDHHQTQGAPGMCMLQLQLHDHVAVTAAPARVTNGQHHYQRSCRRPQRRHLGLRLSYQRSDSTRRPQQRQMLVDTFIHALHLLPLSHAHLSMSFS